MTHFTDLILVYGLMHKLVYDLGGILNVIVSKAYTPPSKISVLDFGLTDQHLVQWHRNLDLPMPVFETTEDCSTWHDFNVIDF